MSEATALYANVKNAFSRASLARKLVIIATAMSNPDPNQRYATLPAEDVAKLVAAGPTLIQVGPSQDGGKTIPVQATTAGMEAVAASGPVVDPVARAKAVVPEGGFAIETGIELPSIQSANSRSKLYPTDDLEIGQSFFVPASAEMPNPGKTLASTVSAANRKYKATTPPRLFTIRKNVKSADGTKLGARVYRIIPVAVAPVAPPAPPAPPVPALPFAPTA